MEKSTYEDVLYEVDGPAAVTTINREERLNAWPLRCRHGHGDRARRARRDRGQSDTGHLVPARPHRSGRSAREALPTRRANRQQLDQQKYIRPETLARLSPAARFILDV
jgi:hypothetical protein